MAKPKVTDADFIAIFEKNGAAKTRDILNYSSERAVLLRRSRLEKRLGRQITGPAHRLRTRQNISHPERFHIEIQNGTVLVAADAHYWPGEASTAHRALVKFCRDMKPDMVVMNGDASDGARISRHPPIGWEARPSLVEELEECKKRMDEIRVAAVNAKLVWPLGNHDARFETRLATIAPEYAKIHGFHLKDHIPEWHPCWACWINDDVVIKHKFKGGIHATHNNTMWAGKTVVTAHDHAGKVTPFADYNGTRFGVSVPALADVYGPQFVDYTEDNPRNHRSGFVVLTFKDGRLLWPSIVHVLEDGVVEFERELIRV